MTFLRFIGAVALGAYVCVWCAALGLFLYLFTFA